MFQIPAVQIVEKYNLTDVIFSSMWFSELPFLTGLYLYFNKHFILLFVKILTNIDKFIVITAVQIQEAYAYVEDINFLAAGANNVAVGSAG